MQGKKLSFALLGLILGFAVSAALANAIAEWYQLFEVHTEVTAIEGVTVWFKWPPILTWREVVDGDVYPTTMKPGDLERFHIKIEHSGETAINLRAGITFPSELELYDESLPECTTTWWDDHVYYIECTMEPGTIGEDDSVWIEYRLAGWAEPGTYTIDFSMWRG